MELIKTFSCCFLVILSITQGVVGFTLIPSMSEEKAVFGNNIFILTCEYQMSAADLFFYIQLYRDNRTGSTPQKIMFFTENGNATIQDDSLVSRTSVTSPTSTSRKISVQFNDIICTDRGSYTWEASYANQSGPDIMSKKVNLIVKAITTLEENVPPSFAPSSGLKEGDNVTFTCTGDVGAEPTGSFRWYYFLDGATTGGTDISSQANNETPVFNDTSCSYSQTTSVVLSMTKEFNGIVLRCEVQQELVKKSKQTKQIPIQYGPRTPTIQTEPNQLEYYKGDRSLNLTCSSDAFPSASYYWVVPDGNLTRVVDGAVLPLTDLVEEDTGEYICVAYNTINFGNYTANSSFSLEVRMTTTTTTTTTTTPSSTESNSSDKPGSSKQDDDGGTDIGVIVGPIVGVVVLVVIIIVVVLCLKKNKKKPEIEEPPEKPRNNQDLTFYGNRPDLVTSELKNNQHNLNTSFSNSYDSSSDIKRNEDGLHYIDLQFDDRPRSRRPIQMIDNGGTSFSDISLPQV